MDETSKNLLWDTIYEIQGKYNDSLREENSESNEDKAFRLGMNFAYYDILDIIESQLKAFGIDIDELELGKITPILGEKITRKP